MWTQAPPAATDATSTADDAILTILVGAVLSAAVQAIIQTRTLIDRASGHSRRDDAVPISPVIDIAFDVAVRAATVVSGGTAALGRLGRRVTLLTPQPLVPSSRFWPQAVLARSVARGRIGRLNADRIGRQVAADLVVGMVDEMLDHIDLTRLVLERVDIDDIVAGIDLGEIAREVIDEIDLPEIIRESSGAMASETLLGMRTKGIEADERVNRAIGRVLLRRRDRATATVPPETETVPPESATVPPERDGDG